MLLSLIRAPFYPYLRLSTTLILRNRREIGISSAQDGFRYILYRNERFLPITPLRKLNRAFGERPLADCHPVRHAQQIGVVKLDSRSFVPSIEEDRQPRRFKIPLTGVNKSVKFGTA